MKAWLRRWSARADRVALWGTRVLRGRGVRRLWLVGASFLAVVGLAFGTLEAASIVAHEERTEVTTVDAAGVTSLAVDNGAGSVTLLGVEGAEAVTVRADISDGLRATGHRVAVRDGVLRVRGSCPLFGSDWCSVSYTIELPADMYAHVTAAGGASATDLGGGLRVHSRNGAIDLQRIGGDLTVSSNHGRVEGDDLRVDAVDVRTDHGRLGLSFATSPRRIAARTSHGQIDLVLPDEPGVAYAPDIGSRESASSSEIRTDPASDRSLTARSDHGTVTVRYQDA